MAKGRERVERGERRPAKITIRWQPLHKRTGDGSWRAVGGLSRGCLAGKWDRRYSVVAGDIVRNV
jgi:hypothetical protein